MSAVQGSRERELQAVVKAKDAELKQANAELVSHGMLPCAHVSKGDLPGLP